MEDIETRPRAGFFLAREYPLLAENRPPNYAGVVKLFQYHWSVENPYVRVDQKCGEFARWLLVTDNILQILASSLGGAFVYLTVRFWPNGTAPV